MTRVACFYDGSYFVRVSNYYKHYHRRNSFLSFAGFHDFVRQWIAQEYDLMVNHCQLVQSHFFRGRFSLQAAKTANALESDRYFDQLLMFAGITSHYYPMNEAVNPPQEKGIDVWMALEAYDVALHSGCDVIVLFISDQDFLPLIRKLHGIGVRALVVAVDIRYTDTGGLDRSLATSQQLVQEATHVLWLDQEIEASDDGNSDSVDGLFAIHHKNVSAKTSMNPSKPSTLDR